MKNEKRIARNKKRQNKVFLKQWVIVILLLIVLVVGGFSIFLLYRALNPETAPRKELYNYSFSSSTDYRVKLKPNNFFTQQYLGMGTNKQYISSLIDNIEVTDTYKISSSKDLDYTYDYTITATAKGAYSDSDGKANEVWSRDYTISPTETKTVRGKEVTVQKTFTINYDEYNKIVSDFRSQSGLSVDSSVDVVLKVNVRGAIPGKENTLNESSTIKMNISLLKPTTTIKYDMAKNGNNTVYADKGGKTASMDYQLLVISCVLLVVSILLIIILVKNLLKATKKSEYVIAIDKILKNYGDIIAETENLPDLSEYDVVNIQKFEDIVDIEEELHSPILANEVRDEKETWFIIVSGKTAYKYVLKYENLGKINNNI